MALCTWVKATAPVFVSGIEQGSRSQEQEHPSQLGHAGLDEERKPGWTTTGKTLFLYSLLSNWLAFKHWKV